MEKKIYVSTEFICNLLSTGAMIANPQESVKDSVLIKHITSLLQHYSNEEGVEVAALADARLVADHVVCLYHVNNPSE